MSVVQEQTNLGLSEEAHTMMHSLVAEGYFSQMADCYRFAVGMAVGSGVKVPDIGGVRRNVFGVATIDPNREVYALVALSVADSEVSIYKAVEQYADWGIREMFRQYRDGDLDLVSIIDKMSAVE